MKVEWKAFEKAIARARSVIAVRNTIPILGCVRITVSGTSCLLTGYDLDVCYRTYIDCVAGDDFDLYVPAAQLARTLPKSGADRLIEVSVAAADAASEDVLIVRDGDLEHSITSTFGAAGQELAEPIHTDQAIEWSTDAVTAIGQMIDVGRSGAWVPTLRWLAKAVSQEETRYYLQGIFFDTSGKHLELVATDGTRLHKASIDTSFDEAERPSQICPQCAFKAIDKLTSREPDVPLMISMGGHLQGGRRSMIFKVNRDSVIVHAVDGVYPNYKKILPKEKPQTFITTDAAKLARDVEAVASMADETKFAAVRFNLQDQLEVSHKSLNGISRILHKPKRTKGQVSFAVNGHYLRDITAHAHKKGSISLRAIDGETPLKIEFPQMPERMGIIMPCRS